MNGKSTAWTFVATFSLTASLVLTNVADAHGADKVAASESPRSATHAISNALANVRSRYDAKLSRYDIAESYFDETSGICDLMLLDVSSWTKYQIVYYRATGQIEWPRMMTKAVAEDLMQDRLIIHQYECSLGKSKAKATTPKEHSSKVASKAPPRKQTKAKPLHKEYAPTPEERAAMDRSHVTHERLKKEQEKGKGKSPLAQQSDLQRMARLSRSGISGDKIASRFGIDRVKEYNKAHPNAPIITSKHSKPCASGFTW